ncbi:MAG: SRPBCC family protein [Candidatus Omnitrophota bacterium]
MYQINLKSLINVPPVRLLRIWQKPDLLLSKAPNLKSLKVITKEANTMVTAWEVEIAKIRIKWQQRDILDTDKANISFKLERGDFNRYEGCWQITPTKKGKSILSVSAVIDWGIPAFEEALSPVLERKSRLMFRSFMQSIRKAAVKNAK